MAEGIELAPENLEADITCRIPNPVMNNVVSVAFVVILKHLPRLATTSGEKRGLIPLLRLDSGLRERQMLISAADLSAPPAAQGLLISETPVPLEPAE